MTLRSYYLRAAYRTVLRMLAGDIPRREGLSLVRTYWDAARRAPRGVEVADHDGELRTTWHHRGEIEA